MCISVFIHSRCSQIVLKVIEVRIASVNSSPDDDNNNNTSKYYQDVWEEVRSAPNHVHNAAWCGSLLCPGTPLTSPSGPLKAVKISCTWQIAAQKLR